MPTRAPHLATKKSSAEKPRFEIKKTNASKDRMSIASIPTRIFMAKKSRLGTKRGARNGSKLTRSPPCPKLAVATTRKRAASPSDET